MQGFVGKNSAARHAVLAAMLIGLAACGGGDSGSGPSTGGGPGPTPTPTPAPTPGGLANIAFVAEDANGKVGLYAAQTEVGEREKLLTSGFGTNPEIRDVDISPDGTQVAFIGRPDNSRGFALYVMPLDGGQIIRLSPESDATRNVSSFEWRPDSSMIAYDGNFSFSGPYLDTREVYTISRDGSSRRKVNVFLGSRPNVEVRAPKWSPNGGLLLMEFANTSGPTGTGVADAYRFDVYNPSANVNTTIVKYRDGIVRNPTFSPDNSKVCFVGRYSQTQPFGMQYFSTSRPSEDWSVVSWDSHSDGKCDWSEDSSLMVYVQQTDSNTPGWLRVLDFGAQQKRGVTRAFFGSGGSIKDFRFGPNSNNMIGVLGRTSNASGVYEVSIESGAEKRISRSTEALDFKWSPGGELIVYKEVFNSEGQVALAVIEQDGTYRYSTYDPGAIDVNYDFVPNADQVVAAFIFPASVTTRLSAFDLSDFRDSVQITSASVTNITSFDVVAPR